MSQTRRGSSQCQNIKNWARKRFKIFGNEENFLSFAEEQDFIFKRLLMGLSCLKFLLIKNCGSNLIKNQLRNFLRYSKNLTLDGQKKSTAKIPADLFARLKLQSI